MGWGSATSQCVPRRDDDRDEYIKKKIEDLAAFEFQETVEMMQSRNGGLAQEAMCFADSKSRSKGGKRK